MGFSLCSEQLARQDPIWRFTESELPHGARIAEEDDERQSVDVMKRRAELDLRGIDI